MEHFSRYGLVSSDSEGEDAAVKQPVQAALTPSSQHGPDADPDDMQEGVRTVPSVLQSLLFSPLLFAPFLLFCWVEVG